MEKNYVEQTKHLVISKMINIVKIMMVILNYSNKIDLKTPSSPINFPKLLI